MLMITYLKRILMSHSETPVVDTNNLDLPIVESIDPKPVLTILERIFRLQHSLNTDTNGVNYLSGVTNTGKAIDYLTCIKMEIGECLGTTPWKH